jgi:hypothetical protein
VAIWGIVAGTVLSLSFRRFAKVNAIRVQRRKLWAHVLGLHLFGDDPELVLQGSLEILRDNVILLRNAVLPLVIASPFVVLIAVQLNQYFESTSLTLAQPGVLTLVMRAPLDPHAVAQLEVPAWLHVESPPVHVLATHEMSWRVRASAEGHGLARVFVSGETASTQVDAQRSPIAWPEWFAAIAGVTAWVLWLAMERLLLLFQIV